MLSLCTGECSALHGQEGALTSPGMELQAMMNVQLRTWHAGAPGSSLSQRCLCVSCVDFGAWVRHYPGLYPLHQMEAFYLLEMSSFNTG